MSDNDLVLRFPHALGAAEAKRRIAAGVASAKAQYAALFGASEVAWDGNTMSFHAAVMAQSIEGTVEVGDDYVELRAKLPLVLRLLTKRFVPVVQDAGQKLLLDKRRVSVTPAARKSTYTVFSMSGGGTLAPNVAANTGPDLRRFVDVAQRAVDREAKVAVPAGRASA